jgi:hypothetical protein
MFTSVSEKDLPANKREKALKRKQINSLFISFISLSRLFAFIRGEIFLFVLASLRLCVK